MKAWLLSMIGVVFLIAIAEMLLPEGKLRKNIRGIFALILMLAVLKPLPYLRNADWDLNFDLALDQALSEALNARKTEAMERDGERYLAGLGFVCGVSLQGSWGEEGFAAASVVVTTSAAPDEVREAAAEYYGVDAQKVVIRIE